MQVIFSKVMDGEEEVDFFYAALLQVIDFLLIIYSKVRVNALANMN